MRIAPLALTLALLAPLIAAAQSVPSTINYQGRLTDNTPQQNPYTGLSQLVFAIYDAPAGGTQLWLEPASGAIPVTVTGGVFSVLLGGNGVPLPPALFSGGTSRYLEVTFNGETLAPRQTITATAYANQAESAASALTAASATSATNAANAANAASLGGLPAANYLLTTGTAANSAQLGGVADTGWQKKLAIPACPAGQSLTTLNPDGSSTCAAPPPSGSADFAYVFLPGGAVSTAVVNLGAVPFSTISGTPPASKISLGLGGNVNIADSGAYLVTAGFASTTNNGIFQLRVNGVGQAQNTVQNSTSREMVTSTVIVTVTNPSVLQLVNISGATRSLNDPAAGQGPCAALTIVKLQ